SLGRPAHPNIDEVLDAFLANQRERISVKTFSDYESVVQLLRSYLNGYGYQGLSKEEGRFFDRSFNATGKDHREFCQLFGPEKIVENVDGVLGDFMIRKVMAGESFKRTSGTVSKKLSKWLGDKGYVSENEAEEGASRGLRAGRALVEAERAARLLQDAADRLRIDVQAVEDENYVDFDHFTISKVEPGRIWLEVSDQDGKPRPRGPIPAPKTATRLLRKGWDVSCTLVRLGRTWYMVEVANVYPT
ncbi:MAG: hypothetical protein ACRD1B_03635, partial [Thermoanaerobaculia bacterium]